MMLTHTRSTVQARSVQEDPRVRTELEPKRGKRKQQVASKNTGQPAASQAGSKETRDETFETFSYRMYKM